jgi:putative SOS response-associated peptidase YedK
MTYGWTLASNDVATAAEQLKPYDAATAAEQLKPYDAAAMRCYPVSVRVNNVVNDDAECSAPVEVLKSQARLF